MSAASGVSAAVIRASRNAIPISFTKAQCVSSIVVDPSSIAVTPVRIRVESLVESVMSASKECPCHVDTPQHPSYATSYSAFQKFGARRLFSRHFPLVGTDFSGNVGRNRPISNVESVAKLSSPADISASHCADNAPGSKSRMAERLSSPFMNHAKSHVGGSIQTALILASYRATAPKNVHLATNNAKSVAITHDVGRSVLIRVLPVPNYVPGPVDIAPSAARCLALFLVILIHAPRGVRTNSNADTNALRYAANDVHPRNFVRSAAIKTSGGVK